MTYEDYVKTHILEPLDMTMSSLNQPLSQLHKRYLAKSYQWDGQLVKLDRDYFNTTPADGFISYGHDMLNYMLMHLNQGRIDSTKIMGVNYHSQLASQQYGSEQTNYGVCYSFFENGWTGRRCLQHTGAQLDFLILLVLIPETGTGIFIAQNSRENAGAFRFNLTRTIFDTLLVRKERYIDLPEPSSELGSIAHRYVGRYQQMNYPHSTFEKLGILFGFFDSAYRVKYNDNGMLALNNAEFVMTNERLFHLNDERSDWNVEFVFEESEKAEKIIAGTISYERTPWYENKRVWQRLLLVSLILHLVNLLKRPIGGLIR